ncbi:AP-1 complex subunit mu-1 [Acipenser ruthenus]|uniref:AP-1 complex subunit mu-1 n=1 Tax=Acipenser ruthenus TaxID=7906 RepID=A0A662YX19_ACIRT|nr:AP-1 complex subunit mu-1 [Acipenser ruthenus]
MNERTSKQDLPPNPDISILMPAVIVSTMNECMAVSLHGKPQAALTVPVLCLQTHEWRSRLSGHLPTQVLISRNYKGDIDMNEIDHFMPILMQKEEEVDVSPFVAHGAVHFLWIKHSNLYCRLVMLFQFLQLAWWKEPGRLVMLFQFLQIAWWKEPGRLVVLFQFVQIAWWKEPGRLVVLFQFVQIAWWKEPGRLVVLFQFVQIAWWKEPGRLVVLFQFVQIAWWKEPGRLVVLFQFVQIAWWKEPGRLVVLFQFLQIAWWKEPGRLVMLFQFVQIAWWKEPGRLVVLFQFVQIAWWKEPGRLVVLFQFVQIAWYITQRGHKLEVGAPRPPATVTNAVSWRSEGIKYRKNEVFMDVIESVNLLVSASGSVLRSEIVGSVKMKVVLSGMPELRLGLNDKLLFQNTGMGALCDLGLCVPPSQVSESGSVLRSEIVGSVKMKVVLSGMPELRLGLNDKLLFQNTGRDKGKAVELEDVKFHQCVRLSRFENDRTISFIPPDGDCELMSYRLNTHVKPLIWIESVIEKYSHSRVEIMVKARGQFKQRSTANNVEITVPVPSDADSPKFKACTGSAKWVPEKNAVIWTIKSFPGGKEYLMRAHFGLPSVDSEELERKPPITVKFEIPYFTVSGIQVRYLKIIEKSGYHALPWVRYITQSGGKRARY